MKRIKRSWDRLWNGIKNGPEKRQAVAFMSLEAMNHGIYAHQMSGFDPVKAAAELHIPDDYQAASVTAFGYYGNAEDLPEDMYKSEIEQRERRPLNETVFFGDFGE